MNRPSAGSNDDGEMQIHARNREDDINDKDNNNNNNLDDVQQHQHQQQHTVASMPSDEDGEVLDDQHHDDDDDDHQQSHHRSNTKPRVSSNNHRQQRSSFFNDEYDTDGNGNGTGAVSGGVRTGYDKGRNDGGTVRDRSRSRSRSRSHSSHYQQQQQQQQHSPRLPTSPSAWELERQNLVRELDDARLQNGILEQQLVEARSELMDVQELLRDNVNDLQHQLSQANEKFRREQESVENSLLEDELFALAELARANEEEKTSTKGQDVVRDGEKKGPDDGLPHSSISTSNDRSMAVAGQEQQDQDQEQQQKQTQLLNDMQEQLRHAHETIEEYQIEIDELRKQLELALAVPMGADQISKDNGDKEDSNASNEERFSLKKESRGDVHRSLRTALDEKMALQREVKEQTKKNEELLAQLQKHQEETALQDLLHERQLQEYESTTQLLRDELSEVLHSLQLEQEERQSDTSSWTRRVEDLENKYESVKHELEKANTLHRHETNIHKRTIEDLETALNEKTATDGRKVVRRRATADGVTHSSSVLKVSSRQVNNTNEQSDIALSTRILPTTSDSDVELTLSDEDFHHFDDEKKTSAESIATNKLSEMEERIRNLEAQIRLSDAENRHLQRQKVALSNQVETAKKETEKANGRIEVLQTYLDAGVDEVHLKQPSVRRAGVDKGTGTDPIQSKEFVSVGTGVDERRENSTKEPEPTNIQTDIDGEARLQDHVHTMQQKLLEETEKLSKRKEKLHFLASSDRNLSQTSQGGIPLEKSGELSLSPTIDEHEEARSTAVSKSISHGITVLDTLDATEYIPNDTENAFSVPPNDTENALSVLDTQALAEEIKDLSTKILRLETERDEVSFRLNEKENEIISLDQKLHDNLSKSNMESSSLQAKIVELQTKISVLEEKAETARQDLFRQKEEHNSQIKEYRDRDDTNKVLLAKVRAENESLIRAVENLHAEGQALVSFAFLV